MALFLIKRQMAGATKEDLDAASYRALACTFVYEGMEWKTSYWDEEREQLTCLYEAGSADQIFDHARRARVPCDEVRPVSEVSPLEYMQGAKEASVPEIQSS